MRSALGPSGRRRPATRQCVRDQPASTRKQDERRLRTARYRSDDDVQAQAPRDGTRVLEQLLPRIAPQRKQREQQHRREQDEEHRDHLALTLNSAEYWSNVETRSSTAIVQSPAGTSWKLLAV